MLRHTPGLVLFALAPFAFGAVMFWRQVTTSATVLPTDILSQYSPWKDVMASAAAPPHNPLLADGVLAFLGWKLAVQHEIREGRLPLWDPSVLAGHPLFGEGFSGALYPPGLLFLVLDPAQAFDLYAVAHLGLAGLFMVLCLRRMGASEHGALIGALAYAFSGFLVTSVVAPMVLGAAVWLPALVWCVEGIATASAAERRAGRHIGLLVSLASLVVALTLLAGHFEIALYTVASALLYGGVRLLLAAGERRVRRMLFRASLMLAAVGIGSLLAAVQIVPFLEAASGSARAGRTSLSEATGYALSPVHALNLVVPNLFGNPIHHNYLDLVDRRYVSVERTRETPYGAVPVYDTSWGERDFVEAALYIGVLPLLLAVAALGERRNSCVVALTALAVASAAFAFGSPLYALLYHGLPGADQIRSPFRWIYPLTFALAALAGLGANQLSARQGSPVSLARWAGIGASSVGLLALALCAALAFYPSLAFEIGDTLYRAVPDVQAGFPNSQAFVSYEVAQVAGAAALLLVSGLILSAPRIPAGSRSWAAVTVLGIDLYAFGASFNPAADSSIIAVDLPTIRSLRDDSRLFRVTSLGPADLLPPNTAALAGVQDARGYNSIIPRAYVDYIEQIETPGALRYNRLDKLFAESSLQSPFLHALNVRYVLSDHYLQSPGYSLVSDGPTKVYRNREALSRAYVVYSAEIAVTREDALHRMQSDGFDPRHVVVLEGGSEAISGRRIDSDGATVLRYTSQEVVVRARARRSGYLILSDAFAPGWNAWVDGTPEAVLRANRAFRAVRIEPGEHEIHFTYQPTSVAVGGALSLLGLLILMMLGLITFRERSTPRAH